MLKTLWTQYIKTFRTNASAKYLWLVTTNHPRTNVLESNVGSLLESLKVKLFMCWSQIYNLLFEKFLFIML